MRIAWHTGVAILACFASAACSDRTMVTPEVGVNLAVSPAPSPTAMERVGDLIFHDTDLSINENQSCASCHGEAWGGTGPIEAFNLAGATYEGSISGRFGDRKPPSFAYATLSPILHYEKGLWVGGNFWDGRATGEKLGNPAADQAQGPFLNPKEQALPDLACVVYRVSVSAYVDQYVDVFDSDILGIAFPSNTDALCATEGSTIPLSDPDRATALGEYDNMALAIEAFEGSAGVNAFTSKFDVARNAFTRQERRGRALFNGKAKCARCHIASGRQPLFTDFTYDNLGVPVNPLNPAYLADNTFRDRGLGAFLEQTGRAFEDEDGKVKVPTLRNVDLRPFAGAVKAYTHNGYFKSLWSLVHFYNTRDVLPECPGPYAEEQALQADCWPAPEWPENVNRDELGNLGLDFAEEMAIVAFLQTLSDGYAP